MGDLPQPVSVLPERRFPGPGFASITFWRSRSPGPRSDGVDGREHGADQLIGAFGRGGEADAEAEFLARNPGRSAAR